MYLPTHFQVDDGAAVADFIAAHPLAQLVSNGLDGELPVVNPLPLRLQTGSGPAAGSSTSPASTDQPWLLEGHLARANPQLDLLRRQGRALVVFGSAGAYVSPALYDADKAVPTWNYITVQLGVRVELVDDAAAKDALLKRLIAVHEPAYAARWRALPENYQQSMLQAIVGLRLRVDSLQAKYKLSQNRPDADRSRVQQAHDSGSAAEHEMAQWMARINPVP
jgi:transcriptional regulator